MAEISSGVCGIALTEYSGSNQVCTYEMTVFALVFDHNSGFIIFLRNFEGPVLHVADDSWVIHPAANEPLGIEDGVFRVGVEGILGGITDTGRKWSMNKRT
jgi:hypothetical protein